MLFDDAEERLRLRDAVWPKGHFVHFEVIPTVVARGTKGRQHPAPNIRKLGPSVCTGDIPAKDEYATLLGAIIYEGLQH